MTSPGVMRASFTTVAQAPAAAVATGACELRCTPNASLATSYVAKYSACAGLHYIKRSCSLIAGLDIGKADKRKPWLFVHVLVHAQQHD